MMNYRDILLCSESVIKSYTNISDNIAGDYLLPAIALAQRNDLENIIGTALVRKLQEYVANGTINDTENVKYKELLDEYITDFLCYASIKELIPIISFKISNIGTTRTDEEKTTQVSFNEVFKLKDYYEDKAEYFGMRLQKYLSANYKNFPELDDNTLSNISANISNSVAGCSIWLGGQRGRIIE